MSQEHIELTTKYLSTGGPFAQSRKVDIQDLLALMGVSKASDVPEDLRAPYIRLVEQLISRPEGGKVPETSHPAEDLQGHIDRYYERTGQPVKAAIFPSQTVADKGYAPEAILTTMPGLVVPGYADPRPAGDTFDTVDGYAPLAEVLREAYDQSAKGKGKERHANGKPFLMQPIMSIGRMVGPGYPLGQAMKKAQEAGGMYARSNTPAAVAELLGVIVYTAAAIMLMKEQENRL